MVNKKIILSVLIIGCLATVAGAGTWAYYTSTATDTGSFTSGNMKITVTQNIDDVDKIVPGYKFEKNPTIVVTNDGNIDIAKTKIEFKTTSNELASNLKFTDIKVNNKDTGISGTLSDLNGKSYTLNDKVIPKGGIKVELVGLNMPKEAAEGNGQTCDLTVTFTGYQDNSQ